MLKVDTHAHAWDDTCHYKEGSRYHPSYTFTAKEYLERLDSQNITYGVLVQPSFLGTDNSYLLKALKRYPSRLRGVVVVDEETPYSDLLAMHQAGVRGIRFNLVGQDIATYSSKLYQDLIKFIQTLGWHLELHALPHQWEEVVKTFKYLMLPVVIDHFGRPENGEVTCQGLQTLLRADLDLHVKLSAPYRFCKNPIEPLINLWEEKVGLEKLLWGTDTPHTTFEDTWPFEDSLTSLGTRVKDQVLTTHLDRNAARLFGITL